MRALLRSAAVLAFLSAASVTLLSRQAPSTPANDSRVDFARDVRPIFQQHCIECHGDDKQMNSFRLDRRSAALRGGTMTVIGRGSAQSSRLYLRLIGTRYGARMPFKRDPLAPEQIDIIKRWIDQGAPWPDDLSGDTPAVPPDPAAVTAFDALRAGDRRGFVAAIEGNPNVSTLRGPGGDTPLMMASQYGDAALVRVLLEAGARPNVTNDAGATPLMRAVDDLEKTRLLVEHGANVTARSDNHRTAVIIASGIRGNHEAVAYLLDHGANPSDHAPGLQAETTPLAEAAKQGDAAMISLLIERGADVAAAGPGPLAFSLRAHCDACIEALLPRTPAPFVTAAMIIAGPPLGPALATPFLLSHGADPNATSPTGYPMLVLAAASDAQSIDVVQALIDRGANVRARGPNGETALDVARQHGRSPLIPILTNAGVTETPVPAAATIPAFAPAHSAAEAVRRSLPLLQQSDVRFLDRAGCVSCHNNAMTATTVATARSGGVGVNETVATQQRARISAYLDDWRERVLQIQGIPGDHDTISEILIGLADEHQPGNAATDAMVGFVLRQQQADGRWPIFGHRPPIASGDIQSTAVSLRAVQAFAPPAQRSKADAALAKAAAWLAQATPNSTHDRAYQILGLHWAGGHDALIAAAARDLVATQRADGGWAQLSTTESDAYATGQALVALLSSGAMTPKAPVIRRGMQFLLRTQFGDGSWHVATRAVPIQPYFDAGFPYGKDQFISAAATNWATQALILASTPAARTAPTR
ncbi:MAG TPA: ankyrin repeat domain-containing protein [Vicinamibacterales bacterium]|nr:ankyrin repeat domain-containing protein [Vicinamibacterales bacterium]